MWSFPRGEEEEIAETDEPEEGEKKANKLEDEEEDETDVEEDEEADFPSWYFSSTSISIWAFEGIAGNCELTPVVYRGI